MSVRTRKTGLIVLMTLLVAATALLGARTAAASTSSSTLKVCSGWWIFRSCVTLETLPNEKNTMCRMEEEDPVLEICRPGQLVGPPHVKLGQRTFSAPAISTFVATDAAGCLSQGGSVALARAGIACWKS